MSDHLFQPEAFKQIPGQLSMATERATDYDGAYCSTYWRPCGTCDGTGDQYPTAHRSPKCPMCKGTGEELYGEVRDDH